METMKSNEPQEEVPSPYKLKWSEMALWMDEVATGKRTKAGEVGNPSYGIDQQVHLWRMDEDGNDQVLILSESKPSKYEKEIYVPANTPLKATSNDGAKTLKLSDFLPAGFVYDCRVIYLASHLADPFSDNEQIEKYLSQITQPVTKSDGQPDVEQNKANQALIEKTKALLWERKNWWPSEDQEK